MSPPFFLFCFSSLFFKSNNTDSRDGTDIDQSAVPSAYRALGKKRSTSIKEMHCLNHSLGVSFFFFLSLSSVSSRPHKHQNVCLPFDLFTALLRWLCSWQDIKFQLLTKSFCCHCASKAWQGAPGFHWTVTRPFWIVNPTDGWRQYTSGLALWCSSSHTQLGRLWLDRQFSHTAMQDLATHTHSSHTQLGRLWPDRHSSHTQLCRMWPHTHTHTHTHTHS